MTQSLLAEVKNSVQKYAQVIANVIGMDVDITDADLIRIAGTGAFAESVDTDISSQGHAFTWTMLHREFLAIRSPGQDEVCRECPNRETCAEKFEICCPIILDGKAIGAIAIATFDDARVAYIVENLESLQGFIENIADLISAKVAEYKDEKSIKTSLTLLKNMIDLINEGVIIFGPDKSIQFLNRKAENLLGYELGQLRYLKKIKEFSMRHRMLKESANNSEYTFRIRGKVSKIQGNLNAVVVDRQETAQVFTFEDVVTMHQHYFQNGTRSIDFHFILGEDKNFLKVKQHAQELAFQENHLLICGENGTGKEIFARAICNEGPRKNKPFVTVSCNGTVDAISEQELFGYLPNHPEETCVSKFELATEGTLFFDGIENLPLRLQARLVDAISNNCHRVRIIAAAGAELEKMVKSGGFRSDLFYILDVYAIHIPPVRRRRSDIRMLVDYFLERHNTAAGREVRLSEDVYRLFDAYAWPGNVREIDSVLSLVVNLARQNGPIRPESLSPAIKERIGQQESETYNLKQLEKQTILKLMNSHETSAEGKKEIAAMLGISPASLYRKLKEYGIIKQGSYKFSK